MNPLLREYKLVGDVGMQQGSILGRAQLAFDIEVAYRTVALGEGVELRPFARSG